jgi:curved DNA-binding protein CbpA
MERSRPWQHSCDPYELLGVATDASRQDIVRAYHRAVHRVHPDTCPQDPDAAARFQALTEAYDLLSDPQRRADFDRGRQSAAQGRGHGTGSPGRPRSRPGPQRRAGRAPAGTGTRASDARPASPGAPPPAAAQPGPPGGGPAWSARWPGPLPGLSPPGGPPLWAGPVRIEPPGAAAEPAADSPAGSPWAGSGEPDFGLWDPAVFLEIRPGGLWSWPW